jgi:hypothetical protein
LSAPPLVDVCMSMPSVMLTMAPDSAWMVSPLASERTASEYDGPYRISDFTACPLSSYLEDHSERVVKAAARRAPEPSLPTVKIDLITRNGDVVATLPTGGLRIMPGRR